MAPGSASGLRRRRTCGVWVVLLLLCFALSCTPVLSHASRRGYEPVQFTPAPPSPRVEEHALMCDPVPLHANGNDDEVQMQHVRLVATHSHGHKQPPSFLFRGALPDRDNFAQMRSIQPSDYHSEFLYEPLLSTLRTVAAQETSVQSNATRRTASFQRAAAPFPSANSDIYLVDVNLMWADRADDGARIQAEHAWFVEHDGKGKGKRNRKSKAAPAGKMILWEMYGTRNNASEEYVSEPQGPRRRRHRVSDNAQLAAALRAGSPPSHYSAPDELDERVSRLTHLLRHTRAPPGPDGQPRSLVLYVHCYCGSDRTGEMMGAWALAEQGRNWHEVNEENTRIAGRPIACANYLALQWWCLQMEGERQEALGCEHNYPCTMWK